MIRSSMRVLLAVALFIAASGTCSGAAQEVEEKAIPTRITSERLRYDHNDQQIEFIGNVRVDRPNFQLRSNRLLIFLRTLPEDALSDERVSAQSAQDQVDIEKMIARGKVFLKHENRVGHGDMATYWVDQEVLRLEGNAVVEEGSSKLEGNVITINVQEKGVDVQGRSERRMEGVFFLPREQGAQ